MDMASVCPAFDSRLWIRPEVHKKPEARLRESEVVENLGAMLFAKLVNGLDFDNYLAMADEVGDIRLLYGTAFVEYPEFSFRLKWYTAHGEFALQALLVHLFPEAVSELTVDLVDCAANGAALLFEHELFVLHGLDYTISVSFRVGSLEPLPCRGHLTPTEGRGGAETLGEGRPGRAVHEKSKGEHCDLQATASTRRLNRRNAARQMRRASVVAHKRSNASTAIFRLNASAPCLKPSAAIWYNSIRQAMLADL